MKITKQSLLKDIISIVQDREKQNLMPSVYSIIHKELQDNSILFVANDKLVLIQVYENYFRIFDDTTKSKGFLQITFDKEYKIPELKNKILSFLKNQTNERNCIQIDEWIRFGEFFRKKYNFTDTSLPLGLQFPTKYGNIYNIVNTDIYVFVNDSNFIAEEYIIINMDENYKGPSDISLDEKETMKKLIIVFLHEILQWKNKI